MVKRSSPNSSEVLVLFLNSLEPTMSNLTTSVNELKRDLLQSSPINLRHNRFPQQTDPLLRSDAAPPDHHEVILHHPVVREPSQRSDVLFGQVTEGTGIVLGALVGRMTDPVHLFVEFGSVMEPVITGPRNSPPYSSRMP